MHGCHLGGQWRNLDRAGLAYQSFLFLNPEMVHQIMRGRFVSDALTYPAILCGQMVGKCIRVFG